MKFFYLLTLMLGTATCEAAATAKAQPATSPEAHQRTSGQNYKDMMLAKCISNAYEKEPGAANDAGASAAVMLEWIDVDLENSIDASDTLLKTYLARNYRHPLVHEYKNIRFDLLKCFDMYHSKALADQVRRYVSKPERPYIGTPPLGTPPLGTPPLSASPRQKMP